MTEQQAERVREWEGVPKALKRRGIFAAAGAVVAGIVAKQTSLPVRASSDTNFVATGGSGTAFNVATGGYGTGVSATGTNYGVYSSVGSGFGVFAVSGAGNGRAGVYGGVGDSASYGVHGVGGGTGVRGESTVTGGIGVHGEIPAYIGIAPPMPNTFPNTTAIHGVNYSSGTNSIGVYGRAVASVYGIYGLSDTAGGCGVRGDCTGGYGVLGSVSDGYGVLGQANTGNGVRGFSSQNHAIVGQTAQPYYGGVFGAATLANTVGIYGSTVSNGANVASAFAGYMDGNFVAVHGVKSAAVPTGGGAYGLVYCMESPECWFEDFGEAKLVGGKAVVTIDPAFAAIVHTDAYHVFLTGHDTASDGLVVTKRRGDGFVVEEGKGGRNAGTFSYRIVAKRKDIVAGRLARFDLPHAKTSHDLKPLQPPAPPPAPVTSKRP
ncbi:MAG: hypothetical protein ACYDAR_09030 [Thermomicrobiales bacterium]